MQKSKGDLWIKYGIKSLGGGAFGEGFMHCLRFMDVKYCQLEKLLEEQRKITKHFIKKSNSSDLDPSTEESK